ncbi:MAG: RNA chaperone Hfq [Pseudomonadota bacterium]
MSTDLQLSRSSQDAFLDVLCKEHVPVSIYLASGIRLVGEIAAYDLYVILLKSESIHMVYKHAIATILPSRAVNLSSQSNTNPT